MISEIGVYFFPNGGHDHDGVNSSLIDTSAYSIFDFEWTTQGSTPFRDFLRETRYTQSFLPAIRQEITNVLFKDAGIFIQPGSIGAGILIANSITANEIAANTITANEIATGTITGDLLNANVVLVNQVIASNNYVPGVSGWAILGNGAAEFANTSIRGTLTAVELLIDGNNFWEDDGFMLGGNTGIYTEDGNVKIGTNVIIEGAVVANAIAINNNNFWNDGGFALGGTAGIYTSNGVVRIGSSVIIEGTIVADEIAINNNNFWNANGFILGGNTGIYTSNGIVRIGTSVIIEGTVAADEVVIDENNYWDADNFSLNGESGVSTVTIGGIGKVVRLGSDIYINPNDGSIFSGSGAFQVQSNGNLFSNSGTIGNWVINDDYLFSTWSGGGGYPSGYNNQIYFGQLTAENNFHGMEIVDSISDRFIKLGVTPFTGIFQVGIVGESGFYVDVEPEGSTLVNIVNGSLSAGSVFLKGGTISTGYYPYHYSDASYMTSDLIYSYGDIESEGAITAGGEIESGGMITAGGTGVKYNASNLLGSRFGIAFAWDQGGYLSCIVNNDNNVRPYFAPQNYYSDRRIKENIQSVASEVLQKIYNIKIYEFDYKANTPQSWLQGKHGIGVIADEFVTLFPEMVITSENPEEYDQVVYVKMIPHLLAAIGDLNTRLKVLEQQLGYNS